MIYREYWNNKERRVIWKDGWKKTNVLTDILLLKNNLEDKKIRKRRERAILLRDYKVFWINEEQLGERK